MSWRLVAVFALAVLSALSLAGCPENPEGPKIHGQTKLTLIHTSDIHSRLFPYALQITQSDASLGLGAAGSVVTVGGVSRIAYIVGRERAKADRALHIDGGDCFQGAPIFNFFKGEPEVRAMSAADGLVGLVLEQLEVVGLLVDLEAHAVEGDKCVCTHGLCAPNSARFIGDGQEGVRGLALT